MSKISGHSGRREEIEITQMETKRDLVKCGKWLETQRKNIWGSSTSVFECSACGKYTVGNKGITTKSRYCPNCGAFMQEE